MQVAPARTRTLAAVIDLAVTSGLGLSAVAGGYASGAVGSLLRGADASGPEGGKSRWERSTTLENILAGATRTIAVAHRDSRSRGFRLLGLQRVDARTGGPVALHSAVLEVFLEQLSQDVTKRVFDGSSRRRRERLTALAPRLAEIKREYAADPEARGAQLVSLYQENEINPFAGCAPSLIGSLVTRLALDLVPVRGRTVRDRVTGTAVVVNR